MYFSLQFYYFCLIYFKGQLLNVLVQFSSVAHSCLTLCDPVDCSTPGLPVHHQLPEFTQTHPHWVGDAIQPSHPLLSPSLAFNLSQHQGLFQWDSSSHQVVKVLEFQLQHQSFQKKDEHTTHVYWWCLSCFSVVSVQFIHSVVSNTLQPHRLQHTRLPCPSPTPGVY